jgi:hypothetical protein
MPKYYLSNTFAIAKQNEYDPAGRNQVYVEKHKNANAERRNGKKT